MEGVEQTKVKHTHSGDTLRNPFNIHLNIKNERHDCKIGTVCAGALVGERRVNEGDEDEGIWLMDFIYLYKKEQTNLLQLPSVGQGAGCGGETVGAI
jgi:hypothetical protein